MKVRLLAVLVSVAVLEGCTCNNVPGVDGGGGGLGGGIGGGVAGGGTVGGGTGGGGGGTGGGTAGGAGGGMVSIDGGPVCTLVTCQNADAGCGLLGDGCGAIIDCGGCTSPATCGGGGVPSKCGGNGGCVPRTCADQNANCGPVSNGCGQILQCGTCTVAGETCGGGGTPFRCGLPGVNDGGGCVPNTSCGTANCGQVPNGCGGLTASCGTCAPPQTCGGGGTASVCGGNNICVPRTCQQADAGCGQVGNGCGALTAPCGTCQSPDICGGANVPYQCGHIDIDAGTCTTPLCQQQVRCDSGSTTVTGTVLAPTDSTAGYGNPDPLQGAFVYVPNGTVQALDAGATCTSCAANVTGNPLVYATTAVNGSFTLSNVPCGTNIPLVIQLGKWRRQITIPNVACCANTALTATQTRLPRRQAEFNPNDNIPRIAVVTGDVDTIECVLPKIGIASTEYSLPSGNGRVRFYVDNGANFPGNAPNATTLFNSLTEMQKYDMIILDCVGNEIPKSAAQRTNMESYANGGGRIFASHYSYVWLYGTPSANSFTPTASWAPGRAAAPDQDAFIDVTFPKGLTFGQWVYQVGAQATSSTPAVPKIRVNNVRNDMTAVTVPPSERWVYGVDTSGTSIPLQYTFNTPVASAPAQQCGRVLFSDFHVIDAVAGGSTWPNQCAGGAMTPQEKVFEYLIFDLSSCVTPYIQNCTPRTCGQQGFTCGQQGDGCGGALNCGVCTAPQTCGGGGTPGVCGGGACVPRTCNDQGIQCGAAGDGCGNTIQCGNCPGGQVCGGGGPGICGSGGCVARTCAQQQLSCGPAGDGCGNAIQCGTCNLPDTCGGGGTPGVCGHQTCVLRTCAQAQANCGPIADGCGGVVDCGVCTVPGDTCGGSGQANVCGQIH